MIPQSALIELATLGLSRDAAEAVSRMLREVEDATKLECGEAIEARRKSDRERKERQRHVKSREVTGQDGTPSLPSSPPSSSPPIPPLITTPSSSNPTVLSSTAEPSDAPAVERIARRRADRDNELLRWVGESWNDFALTTRLAQINNLTPSREAAVLARSRELVDVYDFPDARSGWLEVFAKIRGSPFLLGESGRWRADFDFVVKQSSFTKILEGKYEDQGAHVEGRRSFARG